MKNQEKRRPVSDSPNNEAFEAIVELFYQIKGYITSSGKWFWTWEEGKKQRGYQDIDVLAIGKNETIIVSVSSNLDDKIRFTKNSYDAEKLLKHFKRVVEYLGEVEEYKWIVDKENRKIKYVVAYLNGAKVDKIQKTLSEEKIELVSAAGMLTQIHTYLAENERVKVQNQMLRMVQVLKNSNMLAV